MLSGWAAGRRVPPLAGHGVIRFLERTRLTVLGGAFLRAAVVHDVTLCVIAATAGAGVLGAAVVHHPRPGVLGTAVIHHPRPGVLGTAVVHDRRRVLTGPGVARAAVVHHLGCHGRLAAVIHHRRRTFPCLRLVVIGL